MTANGQAGDGSHDYIDSSQVSQRAVLHVMGNWQEWPAYLYKLHLKPDRTWRRSSPHKYGRSIELYSTCLQVQSPSSSSCNSLPMRTFLSKTLL